MVKKEPSEIVSESECDKYFEELISNKVDINRVYDKLLTDGLEAFKESFKDLLSKLVKE